MRRHRQVFSLFCKPPETEKRLKHCQLFTIQPGVRDGQICYLRSPIGRQRRKDDRECVCVCVCVCERSKELARWDLQRRQWELKVPREDSEEHFQVRCHPSASVIGCFCPTTADSPSYPGQLVEKKRGLSCSAILSAEYQEQIFLIVKKRSAALQGPQSRGGIVHILLFFPIFLLSLLQL